MNFDFDIETSKKGTHSIKWEFTLKDGKAHRYGDHADPQYGAERILPMWVADMDFRCAPPILKALSERVARGTFGYSMPADSYYEAVIDWMSRRYGRTIQREWIALTPGVVPAVNMLIETFIQPGDKVLIQQPVYYPFFNAIKNNGADIVSNSLLLQNGRYQMDFDDLAQKAADPAVKLTILCSPHNPVGRVWSREELTRFGEICQANDVLVVSDEVHCDLIFEGHDFVSYAAVNDTFEQTSIVCTAPSKTFNLAGLKTSNIIIPDKTLHKQFAQTTERHGLMGSNALGLIATEAAYNDGEAWLTAVMDYIQANYHFMADFFATHLPQMPVISPEGTYLVWVDFRVLGLETAARKALFAEKAKIYLDEGELFGVEGEGFERFNIACPRAILAEALERIVTAVEPYIK